MVSPNKSTLNATKPLAGLTITYTRGEEHWLRFNKQICSLGARAIHMPLLTITDHIIPATQRATLAQAEFLIFTSVNAVNSFFSQGLTIEPWQKAVSIGEKTTQAIMHSCCKQSWPEIFGTLNSVSILTAPPPYNSESLLTVFKPKDKKIVIIAAKGGRQYLYEQLQRNNRVNFIYSYQRSCQPPEPTVVQQSAHSHALIITSCTALDCLMENYPHKTLKLLQYNAYIAGISAKVADYAQSLGFRYTIHAHQASEQALIDAILYWWSTHKELES